MESWSRRCRWVLTQLLWNRGEPDPRVLQSSFTIVLVAALVFRIIGDGPVGLVSWPVAGIALSLAGALVVMASPLGRYAAAPRALAVAHIAALGMIGYGTVHGAPLPLVLMPGIWLGLELGMRGVALATASVAAFVSIPILYAQGIDLISIERALVLPGVVAFAAFATRAALTVAQAAQAGAEAREADLARALRTIEQSERSAQAIFEAVDVGLTLLDRSGQAILMNRPLEDFQSVAYPHGEHAESWVFDETGRERMPLDDVPTNRARRGEEFDDLRVWIGQDERSRRAMSVSARRVEDSEGNWLGAAVSYTDITDFMNALQVKDDFIALVSHELRTPLTSIIGYVAMDLEMDDLPPMLRKHLEIVARNGERLERLVDGLLEEVEHSGRPLPVNPKGHDLAALVRDSVAAASRTADRAGITLDADLPDRFTYTGDPQRLAQVVDNLVSNAIKYNEPGGSAQVQMTVEEQAVVIRVRDTGIGIEAHEQDQLFQRFFRTGEATRRAIQGVGLGLSVSRSIVDSHGGWIEVESEPGRGSEFRVVLPLEASLIAS